MKDRPMKIQEVADFLGVCRRTVERLIAAGKLRRIKLPMGGPRVMESEVLALLKQDR